MLLAQFIKESVNKLQALYSAEESRSVVLILCECLIGTKSYTHIVEPQFQIPEGKSALLNDAMSKLLRGEPLQYVTGRAEFCGREFRINGDVLIPRLETELLCVEAMRVAGQISREKNSVSGGRLRILDLCTGSGCIAWTLASASTEFEVVAVDISDGALDVASNQPFELHNKPEFIKADVLDTDNFPDLGQFDMLLSNPPYIKESEKAEMRRNVLDYEPSLALFVSDEDPLVFYKSIAVLAKRLLSRGGVALVEINEDLGLETKELMQSCAYSDVTVIKDLNDKDRMVRFIR